MIDFTKHRDLSDGCTGNSFTLSLKFNLLKGNDFLGLGVDPLMNDPISSFSKLLYLLDMFNLTVTKL